MQEHIGDIAVLSELFEAANFLFERGNVRGKSRDRHLTGGDYICHHFLHQLAAQVLDIRDAETVLLGDTAITMAGLVANSSIVDVDERSSERLVDLLTLLSRNSLILRCHIGSICFVREHSRSIRDVQLGAFGRTSWFGPTDRSHPQHFISLGEVEAERNFREYQRRSGCYVGIEMGLRWSSFNRADENYARVSFFIMCSRVCCSRA